MRSQRLLLWILGPLSLLLISWSLVDAQNQGGEVTATSLEPILEPPTEIKTQKLLRQNAIVKAVRRVRKAVVNIHSERTINNPVTPELFALPSSQNRVNGMGTGIVIDPRGYIVTNHHVVQDVNLIKVRLNDGTTTTATVIARNRDSDLALLKITVNRSLPTIPLGTAKDVMEGEDVIAIGNAFGYNHTVSRGIVSAIKRDVSLNKQMQYRSLIQTDASINPGNSGGPLVNIYGDLIGVNVAIRAGAQGIGFAIPVDIVIEEVSNMLRSIRSPLADDGMTYEDEVTVGNEETVRKVVVREVDADGAAKAAGIQINDQLLQIGNVPIHCSYDVDRALLGHKNGDTVIVVVRRKNQHYKTELVLKKSEYGRPGAVELVWNKLGLQLVPVGKELVQQVNQQLNGGMQVSVVAPNGAAARSGIRYGDILVGLHQWETLSLENVAFVLLHPDLPSFNPLSFYIIRDNQVRRGWIQTVE